MSRWTRAREARPVRTWAPAETPWLGRMAWRDLLFLHWPVDPAALQEHVPAGVSLDVGHGSAWLTVSAHQMRHAGPRLTPPLPPFAELNVRTYVTADGKPGVLFLSLHAPRGPVVAVGRALGLPYVRAQTVLRRDEDVLRFASRAGDASFAAAYRPTAGRIDDALHRFLSARYCLYTHRRTGGTGSVLPNDGPDAAGRSRARWRRIDVRHPPWRLQEVEVRFDAQRIVEPFGASGPPAAAAYAEGVDVVVGPPRRLAEAPDVRWATRR